ncbi:DUF6221 family protein [Streptomyces acidiscabies]|uniref:DUF6221 family protein n=1 Tax=Streptomyces acidiscabies TaxID=42234 RepID=UPI00073F9A9F|nr:DUF6221 family protein [Streptomyces acidiscabies]GAQ52087.1 hypothetical protein a10_01868 [Streptomyces acidiscabies]
MGDAVDLAEFVRARLDEDERVAKALFDDPRPGRIARWEWCDDSSIRDRGTPHVILRVKFTWLREAAHITRHDPARVLREVDAKRQMLAIHRPYVAEPGQACLGCAGGIEWETCPVVRLLALPYADHPDYREEWRP